MFRNAARTQVVGTLLVIAGIVPLSGCASDPLLPHGALAWTGYAAGCAPAPPRERTRQAAVPAVPARVVAGPVIAAYDRSGPPALPESPRMPVLRQNAANPPVPDAKRMVLPVNSTTFDQHVLQSEVPVLVDFYADWCGPCKALAPALDQVAAENPQARVVKVNIDASPELAARYGVKSVPRLLVFKDGQIAAQQNGVVSKSWLNAMLAL